MFEIFNGVYAAGTSILPKTTSSNNQVFEVSEPAPTAYNESVKQAQKVKNAALILHDIGTKEERKDWVEDFKAGNIDLLFVYNMLLTGFDAKRLKKLYLGRLIRKHNLLQALTRVNRTYKDFRYGYVVDFADIRKEFDATNKAYFDELQSELGDEMEHYSHLFKSQEEIKQEIEHIKDILFRFDTDNMEEFCNQISQIQDRDTVLALKKVLGDARSLYNLIRLQEEYDFLDELDFAMLNVLYRETSNHLDLLNLKNDLESGEDTSNLLNRALENVIFKFVKIGEEELVLADKLKNTLRQTREALASNFDQQDPQFINLKEELERLFKKKNLSEVTQDEMVANIDVLNKIHNRVKELNRQNNQLRQKYLGDVKYTRIHKRILERGDISESERKIFDALVGIKQDADEQVLNNSQVLDNESYFERQMMPLVIARFMKEQKIKLNADASRYINHLVVAEYLKEFNTGSQAW
jgi:type I restriction enzyme R subunit